MNKLLLAVCISGLTFSCSKESSDKAKVESDVASCKMLHLNSESVFKEGQQASTYSQVCFESATMLTQKQCESSASQFDKDLKFYELFMGETRCPTANVVATCSFANYHGEKLTVYHYKNDAINTDLKIVELACTDENSGVFLRQ